MACASIVELARTAKRDALKERLGKVLGGRFRLESSLGAGGTGAVYRARTLDVESPLPSVVAVKILHPHLLLNPAQRTVFLEEARIAGLVEHPGAVRVFDAGVSADGTAFIVLEHLTGRSLHDGLVGWGDLLLDEVVRVVRGVLEVLAAAHRHGIVHCDVKPENVFVCNDGTVKLLDFGVARVTGEARRTGVAGTAAFMAPEQACGDWASVDARSDVWSVGATFYTLITGAHLVEGAPPLLPDDVPEPLSRVVRRALEANPKDRWSDARAMLDALIVAAIESGVPRSSRDLGAAVDVAASAPAPEESYTLRVPPYPVTVIAPSSHAAPVPKRSRWRWLAKLGLGTLVIVAASAVGAGLALLDAPLSQWMSGAPAQIGKPLSTTTTSSGDVKR